ncbi:efflux RND transporter periplasmic adaptor subunit [Granulicella sibirica]|uniref:Putative Co/Zn/Cd efflux system membrane fusion protein n=1 Tax=Granulicella sibirica TaxID=2479048 RepID=A0A4Q0T1C7_9BACT|nr:efflux RND transporter periplasmic adaptor subunit [Granulicella sibirica]RXH55226.1 putative Co/Zn/Cd efflux system membrane fusion protein [Granulicella sibirica]
MTQSASTVVAGPDRPNRSPYVAAAGFFLLLVVVGGVALVPKLRHRDTLKDEAVVAAGPPIVLATKLVGGDKSSRIEMPANIQAFEETTIFARTSGYIKERYVDIGDHVRKGQLLAVIEDPQTAQSLLQAEATLAQTKAQLLQAEANAELSATTNKRWQALVGAGVVAQQDADQKRAQAGADAALVTADKANITASQANVNSLSEQASFSKVTAPFDGIILTRSIDRGSLITVGSQTGVPQMFTIAQSGVVRVFANVPQANAVGLKAGQPAQVVVRELGGEVFPGTITRTSQSLDPGTRTLLVEVDLKNDGRILPGMYATVRYDLAPTATAPVMLPANALVIRTAGPQAVVVDSDNVAHFKSVVLGRDVGSGTEIISGVKAGDTVILSPDDQVVDGGKVKPQMQALAKP